MFCQILLARLAPNLLCGKHHVGQKCLIIQSVFYLQCNLQKLGKRVHVHMLNVTQQGVMLIFRPFLMS